MIARRSLSYKFLGDQLIEQLTVSFHFLLGCEVCGLHSCHLHGFVKNFIELGFGNLIAIDSRNRVL